MVHGAECLYYYLQTFLEAHNDKHAHFKIQPRFKVKGEGDIVSNTYVVQYGKQL